MLNLTPEQINSTFPVIGITAYPGGIVIRRSCNLTYVGVRHSHLRGEIALLSKRSLNRLALLVRSSGIKWGSLMTLTYGVNYPHNGRVAKKHLNAFLVAARREFGPFEYFWVLEFQERGAVHFHIATTLPEPDIFQREAFAHIWARISQEGDWPYLPVSPETGCVYHDLLRYTRSACYSVHVHPKSWEKVKSDDGMGRYLAKYANKLKQKEVPVWYRNVGRFWGVSRGVKLPEGRDFYGNEAGAREVLGLHGRDVNGWKVLPKIVLC